MILGVDWLKVHNPILFDFETSSITITSYQKPMLLKWIGDLALQYGLWCSKNLLQRKRVDFHTSIFCIWQTEEQLMADVLATDVLATDTVAAVEDRELQQLLVP